MSQVINRKFLVLVRLSNSKKWHDQDWHDFQSLPEVLAVNDAFDYVNMNHEEKTPTNYIKNAKMFLELAKSLER